ncbi:MAG: ribonuclease HIII [Cyanobacteriota bacterium]
MQLGLSQVYENIKVVLESDNFSISDYKSISYGLQFEIKMMTWSGLLRVYQNNKGNLKIDYSQLKGDSAKIIRVQELIETAIGAKSNLSTSNPKATSKSPQEPLDLGFPIIGTDEAGKGDYFGSLVTAGVYVDEISAKKLLACGIKDSKRLNDTKNIELANQITEICSGKFAIIEISPEKYNRLYENFKKEGKNLNNLLGWSHAKVIEEVLSRVDCQVVVSDQFADERVILSQLQEKGKGVKLVQMHKAEINIAVAAASILARARFLENLSKLSGKYKVNLPKGASSAVITSAREFVNRYDKEDLGKVAKLHFKITEEVFKV